MLDHNLIKKWLLAAMARRRWQFRTTVQMISWVYFQVAYETPPHQAFLPSHFSMLVDPFLCWLMLNSDIGFSDRFSSNFKWIVLIIAFNWSLSTCDRGHHAPHLPSSHFIFRLPGLPVHCVLISSPWDKWVFMLLTCLCFFTTHFEMK